MGDDELFSLSEYFLEENKGSRYYYIERELFIVTSRTNSLRYVMVPLLDSFYLEHSQSSEKKKNVNVFNVGWNELHRPKQQRQKGQQESGSGIDSEASTSIIGPSSSFVAFL